MSYRCPSASAVTSTSPLVRFVAIYTTQQEPQMKKKKKCLILIPGIGGFPDFHQDLISNLSDDHGLRVSTGPHGDFNSRPFRTLDQHTAHWSAFINSEAAKGEIEIHLIGISYGAAIAASLPDHILTEIKTITLVSPPHLPRYFRTILRCCGVFNSAIMSKALGKFLFWWSERQVEDTELLREQRKNLYDDYSLVYRRLWNRLYSLLDMPSLANCIQTSSFPKLGIIYAKDEYAYTNSPFRHFSTSFLTKEFDLFVIPGDHSESIRNSSQLVSAIKKSIGSCA